MATSLSWRAHVDLKMKGPFRVPLILPHPSIPKLVDCNLNLIRFLLVWEDPTSPAIHYIGGQAIKRVRLKYLLDLEHFMTK